MVYNDNVTDLSGVSDFIAFIEEIEGLLTGRWNELIEARKIGGDVGAVIASWKQITNGMNPTRNADKVLRQVLHCFSPFDLKRKKQHEKIWREKLCKKPV